jgi:hypothetical protein
VITNLSEMPDLRASDTERTAVTETLRDHAAAGRLDADELEERLERALSARTQADLASLTADLPAAAPQRRPERRSLPIAPRVIAVAVLLVAIWALTGAGYFWPMWPIGGMALGVFKHRGQYAHWRRA